MKANLKRNDKILIIVFAVLIAFTVAFIFRNSLQPGDASNASSLGVMGKIKMLLGKFINIPDDRLHVLTRKLAHVSEFALLGGLCGGMAYTIGRVNKRAYIAAPLLFGVCVAITDESLQSFRDRAPLVTDVMIDFAGAALGFAFVMLVAFIIVKRKNKK